MFCRGALGCLALKARHRWHFPMCSFTWAAIWAQKNQLHMTSSMCSRPRWLTSLWHPVRVTYLYAAGKTSWKRVSSDSLGLALLYRTLFHSKRWFHFHKNWWNSAVFVSLYCCHPQGSILQSRNDQMQGWICLPGLMAVFQDHTGNLLTVLHWAQDVQNATVCLYEACMTFKGSLLHSLDCCSCDWMWVPELSGMQSGQDTFNKVSASILVFPAW